MKWVFLFLLLIAAGGGAYAYHNDPAGFMQRVDDLKGAIAGLLGQKPAAEVAADLQAAAPKAWAPPAVIPAQADWSWTTAQGSFHKVRILKVEADCVTILDDEGGALVPISSLPSDLQRQLNYDPAAAAVAAAERRADDARAGAVMAQERSMDTHGGAQTANDYQSALAAAKQSGHRILIHFTGSDWCPYCKYLDNEVIASSAFQQFAAANYIYMMVDFPHSMPLSPEVKAQNDALQQKFGISGFPTLLVVDANEHVLGKYVGYNPGTGPGPVIAQLQSYH